MMREQFESEFCLLALHVKTRFRHLAQLRLKFFHPTAEDCVIDSGECVMDTRSRADEAVCLDMHLLDHLFKAIEVKVFELWCSEAA